jgi:uncharacterized protein YecT (DUF1311 family)
MNILISSTLLLFSVTAATAKSEPAFKCNPNGNQPEISQCAADDYTASDKKLNDTWKKLMDKFSSDKTATAKLKTAQKAWIVFRDAEVEAQFACGDKSGNCWGSMESMLRSGVLKELTDARTERLQKYIDNGLGVPMGN